MSISSSYPSFSPVRAIRELLPSCSGQPDRAILQGWMKPLFPLSLPDGEQRQMLRTLQKGSSQVLALPPTLFCCHFAAICRFYSI